MVTPRTLGSAGPAVFPLALGCMFEGWSRSAQAREPSPARSQARRLLGAVAAGASERVKDEEYRSLVQQYRWR